MWCNISGSCKNKYTKVIHAHWHIHKEKKRPSWYDKSDSITELHIEGKGTYCILKNCPMKCTGCERDGLEHLSFQRTQIWFPAPMVGRLPTQLQVQPPLLASGIHTHVVHIVPTHKQKPQKKKVKYRRKLKCLCMWCTSVMSSTQEAEAERTEFKGVWG